MANDKPRAHSIITGNFFGRPAIIGNKRRYKRDDITAEKIDLPKIPMVNQKRYSPNGIALKLPIKGVISKIASEYSQFNSRHRYR